METWIIWLAVAALLGVAEIITGTLALGLTAMAALAAAAAGLAGGSGPLQFGLFAVIAAAALGAGRPLAVRRGSAALIGRTAVVVREISGNDGRVRIGADLWPSRSFVESLVIPVGTWVAVLQIEGTTVLVYPSPPVAGASWPSLN